jgi:site-specific DNA-methyltransferase (adenine-specific)
MIEENQIHQMDCLEGMKLLPEKSVDCIITDPPYGDNSGYGKMDKEIQNNENPLLNCQVLFEAQRILKQNSTIYNFTNWKHYPFLTEFIMRYTCFNIRMMLVLNKNRFGLGYGFRNQHELVLVLEKGKPTYNDNDFSNIMNFKVIEHNQNTHPHEKPESILRKMIKHSTQEGDLVLDCFMGSGSTGIACKQLNRRFIGFEIEEKWVLLGKKRLSQNTLFSLNDFERRNKNDQTETTDCGLIEEQRKSPFERDIPTTECKTSEYSGNN